MRKTDFSDTIDIYYNENTALSIAEIAVSVAERNKDTNLNRLEVAAACQRLFPSKHLSLLNAIGNDTETDIFRTLSFVGSLRKISKNYHQMIDDAALAIEKKPHAIEILVPWVLEELGPQLESASSDEYIMQSSILVSVLAECAERLPGEFHETVERYPVITQKIAECAKNSGTFTARQASFRILAAIGVIEANVEEAILEMLRDVVPVQHVAFQSLQAYKEIDPEFVSGLLKTLNELSCPTSRYLIARVLACLANSFFVKPEVRMEIITGILETIFSHSLNAEVHIFQESEREDGSKVYRLVNLGHLDRLLYQILMDLSGVSL